MMFGMLLFSSTRSRIRHSLPEILNKSSRLLRDGPRSQDYCAFSRYVPDLAVSDAQRVLDSHISCCSGCSPTGYLLHLSLPPSFLLRWLETSTTLSSDSGLPSASALLWSFWIFSGCRTFNTKADDLVFNQARIHLAN